MAKQHLSAIKKCEKLVNQGKWQQAQQEIGRLLSRQPKLLAAWHLAIDAAIGAHDYAGAEDYARQALEHFESEVNLHVRMAQILRQNGYTAVARQHAERAIDLDTSSSHAHLALANILLDLGEFTLGLEHALQAEKLDPKNHKAVATQAQFHRFMGDFAALENCYLRLHEQQPNDPVILNNLGNVYKDVGRFEEAEQCYRKALELNPRNSRILSNLIISVHYNPDYSAEQIAELAKEWQRRFAPKHPPARRSRSISDSSKRLRLGLVSDGLANHPVGNMITSVLQELDPRQFDLRAYSSAKREDHISYEIKQLTSDWQRIEHLSDDALEAKIRADEIDILFDLSGHNNGNRLEVIARQPAPLIVKWVGGLIGTTGVEAIDYLLSDTIETPEGVDDYYTETLIRMPDDYICYRMPPYAPPVGPSPVERNGYITFGCLNNPAKINPILLRKWAGIMHQLPNSRLFLKGKQYASESFCERIYQIMEEADIPRSRVILEGPAKHQEFMGAYDKIDIALDSWPYSGGLTTCEAMIMGVPVITMPGPTFAGRHSATHVTNAGFPEWVAEDWEDYERKVVALAKDANHLAELRKTLRETVLNSPLCDAKRFAKFFTIAMRAIWQRHCSGKPPAPLRFNAEGQAYFEGEEGPVVLEQAPVEQAATPSPAAPQPSPSTTGEEFKWELEGRIVTVDHGCNLLKREELNSLLHTKAFAIVVFDPRGEVKNPELYSAEDAVQIIAHNALGDGQPTELHATLDPALTGTLKPCAPEALPEELRKGAQLLAKVPINTHALDNIEGLSHLDWLLLDDLSDAATILKHGSKLLSNALLIDVRIPFQPTHEGQPTLDSLNRWAIRHGFRFYCLARESYRSHLPEREDISSPQGSELVSAHALYIPHEDRLAVLSNKEKRKLAFILSAVYRIKDLAFRVLASTDEVLAESYLHAERIVKTFDSDTDLEMTEGNGPEPARIRDIRGLMAYLENAPLRCIAANHKLPGHLVVSLTSYSARFGNLHLTLRSLLLQKTHPDVLVLWIAEEEKDKLPAEVLDLQKLGLTIRFCEDIRSYKKIIPTLRTYPQSFIVTADDDLFYENDWLEALVNAWDGDYKTVVAHRAHKITLNDKGHPAPYKNWKWQVQPGEPVDGLIFPTSGAGVLYPPGVFHRDVTRSDIFLDLCPTADDVWLYWMSQLNGASAMRSAYLFRLIAWPDSQQNSLWIKNIHRGRNDEALTRVIKAYGPVWKLRNDSSANIAFVHRGQNVLFHLPNRNDHIQRVIASTRSFYELQMLEDIRSRLGAVDAVFDIGANIGNHTVFFSMFLDAKRIYSFEPHPETFRVLEKNVRTNLLEGRVICYNLGLSDKSGQAEISYYDEANTGMAKLRASTSGEIGLRRADDIAQDQQAVVGLMKIDVEGMELNVLKGSERILINDRPLLYIEASTDSELSQITNFLSDFGYIRTLRFNATPTYLFVHPLTSRRKLPGSQMVDMEDS